MFSAILATFLHVSVDRILGDVFMDIKAIFLNIFPRFLEHHKKHRFLIDIAARPNHKIYPNSGNTTAFFTAIEMFLLPHANKAADTKCDQRTSASRQRYGCEV